MMSARNNKPPADQSCLDAMDILVAWAFATASVVTMFWLF